MKNTTEVLKDYDIQTKSKVKQEYPILITLPGTHPPKDTCGNILPYNMGHLSKTKDLLNSVTNEFEYSVHAEKGHEINCHCWECIMHWNSEPSEEGRMGGPLFEESLFVNQKIRAFQHKINKIMSYGDSNECFQNLKDLFFREHEFEIKNGNKRKITLTGKMGPEQKRNLLQTLTIISKKSPKYRKLPVYHYIISHDPNTNFETNKVFSELSKHTISIALESGIFGGVSIFHPFRIPGEFNEREEMVTGPHFHIIGFGHVMFEKVEDIYKRENVVVKVLHDKNGHIEPITSIFETAEYILSHHGISWKKDKAIADLQLYNRFALDYNSNNMSHKFILPHRKSSQSTPLHDTIYELIECPLTFNLKIPNSTYADILHTVNIEEVTNSSLNYHEFLRSTKGYMALNYIKYAKTLPEYYAEKNAKDTDLNEEDIEEDIEEENYEDIEEANEVVQSNDQHDHDSSKSKQFKKRKKRERTHPVESIRWFGILTNNKNILWGFHREKPEFYCKACKIRIPQTAMFYVEIYKESETGPIGPPTLKSDTDHDWNEIDELSNILSMDYERKSYTKPQRKFEEMKPIPSDQIHIYFPEYVEDPMEEGEHHTGIFIIPIRNVRRIDTKVFRYLFK